MCANIVFFGGVLFGYSGGDTALATMPIEDVNMIIDQFKKAEQSIQNVKIKAEMWTEESVTGIDSWERGARYILATSWFEDVFDAKARIDVHTDVTEGYWWDKARFIVEEKSYTASYNGTEGRVIYFHETPDGRATRPLKRGEVLDQRPTMFTSGQSYSITGSAFTLQGYFINREDVESFSQFFEKAISHGALENVPGLEFAYERHEDVSAIRVGLKGHPSVRLNYWFDPNRGYALMGHENVSIAKDGTEFVNERIRITKLQEVAEGIWWPIEAIIETDRRDERKKDKPYRRTVFRAIEVIVNDPEFDESIFNVSFPAGYTVEDKINNKTYVVPETPEK